MCIRANAVWRCITFMLEMASHKDSIKLISFLSFCFLSSLSSPSFLVGIAWVTPTQEVGWGVYVFQHRSAFPLRDITCTWVSHHTFRFPLFPQLVPRYLCTCMPVMSQSVCEETQREKKGGQLLSWYRTVVSTPSSCLANLPWVSLACCQAADSHTHTWAIHAAALCQGWCIRSLHGSFSLYFFSVYDNLFCLD